MPLPAPNAPSERRPVIFTDEQIRELVGYVASFDSGPPIPDVVVEAPTSPRTEPLHRELRRLPGGQRARAAPSGAGSWLGVSRQSDPTTVAEAAMIGGPGPMPRFSFGQDQLNALAAYVQFLREPRSPAVCPSPGQTGPVAEGFIAGFGSGCSLLVLVGGSGDDPPPGTAEDPGRPTVDPGGDDDRGGDPRRLVLAPSSSPS